MAIKRNTIFNFSRNFATSMLNGDNKILRAWSLLTEDTLVKAQKLAPVASSALEGSGDRIKARITSKGVESFVLFKVDYAKKLNNRDADIRLKNPGEISYYANGTVVNKQRKGVLGFLDIAVDSNRREFLELAKERVSKDFISI